MTSLRTRFAAVLTQPDAVQRWLFGAGGVLLALVLRLSLWNFETTDFTIYSGPWQDYIIGHGGWRALRDNFGNYTPPYLYLLVIGTYLPLSKLYVIKLISLPLDFFLAAWVAKLVGLKYANPDTRLLVFLGVLFVPTTFFNSALWGQTDAGYTTLLLATVYYIIKERPAAAMWCFGFAFALKLQSVFLAPLLVILFLRGVIRWRHLLLVPLPYFLCLIPAWIIGRPLKSLLGIYTEQAAWTEELTKGAANFYQWFPNNPILGRAGLIFAASLVYLFCLAITRRRPLLTPGLLIKLALFSTLLVPYTVPRIHERYFFPADMFAIIYACYYPRRWYVPFIVCGVSLLSYFPFLFGGLTPFGLGYLAVPLGLVLILAGLDIFKHQERS